MGRLLNRYDRVPADLREYDAERWVSVVVDEVIESKPSRGSFQNLSRAQLKRHWHLRLITAPSRYHEALRRALGDDVGSRYYEQARPRLTGAEVAKWWDGEIVEPPKTRRSSTK
jgi:hypothetical protein